MALGWLLLVEGASWVLWGLGRWGSTRGLHRAERRWAAAVRRTLGIRLDLGGVDRVDPGESYVVVSLHEGLVDPVALLHLPLPLRFLVRDELFGWPGLSRYLRATGQPAVPTRPDRASLRQLTTRSAELLDSGESLVVFAQGSVLGIEVGFAEGAVRLARRTGRRLLPVVVTGSHRVWEHPFASTVRLGQRVSLRVLNPVHPDADLRALERRMKRVALSDGMAPARRFEPTRDGWWDGYAFEIDPDFPELARRVAEHRRHLSLAPEEVP